jgi:multicomponent Na+:H+ antiporter subunit G
MSAADWVTAASLVVGGFFFLAGTVGLLRFPDLHSRLHALTKADNLGLGFVVFGLCLQSGGPAVVFKLILIWLLSLLASSTSCYLIANSAARTGAGAGRTATRGGEGDG